MQTVLRIAELHRGKIEVEIKKDFGAKVETYLSFELNQKFLENSKSLICDLVKQGLKDFFYFPSCKIFFDY